MSANLIAKYEALVRSKKLAYDENQYSVLQYLNRLCNYVESTPFNLDHEVIVYPGIVQPMVRGLYIYGEVGTGKTMLMDLFYSHCKINSHMKRRVHFHNFMLEVHQRIWNYKQNLLKKHGRDINVNLSSERDAITQVAMAMSKEAKILCFDEFQVTDVADAMILTKFFSVLWQNGTILIATSNRPPTDLYKNGLNRQYFLPFLDDLQRLTVVKRIGGTLDYRQSHVSVPKAYFTPLNARSHSALWEEFLSFSPQKSAEPEEVVENVEIPVMMGRTLSVEFARPLNRACFVSFASLCEKDTGASDYKSLCSHYSAIFVYGIPQLSVLEHDKARRFITLIDSIYDASRLFVWTAAVEPSSLFRFLTPDEFDKKKDMPLGTDHQWTENAGDVGGWRYTRTADNSKFGAYSNMTGANYPTSAKRSSTREVLPIVPRVDTGVTSFKHSIRTIDAAQEELKLLEGELCSVQELSFAFRRAASRLVEMAGSAWRNREERSANSGIHKSARNQE